MAAVDQRLVAPNERELTTAVRAACVTINRNQGRHGRLNFPPDDLRDILRRVATRPEGGHRWEGAREHSTTPAMLALAWWTDRLGRAHVRLYGVDHTGWPVVGHDPPRLPGPGLPPLACVYPRHLLLRHRGGARELLCVCSCGTWGPPADIAWMGDRCGVCHDRLESGDEAARPFAVLACPGKAWHLAVTPDGRTIQAAFGLNTATQTRAWDLTTGRLVAEGDTRGCLGLALSPAGDRSITSTLSIQSGVGVEVVPLAGGDRWTAPASQFAVLADGSGLVAGDHEGWRVHDLTGTIRKTVPFPLGPSEGLRALACSPDGRHLAAVYSRAGLLIWDLHLGVEKARMALSVPIDRAVYHPAGTPLALCSEEAGGTVYLFEGTALGALPIGASPRSPQFCPRADCLVVWTYPSPTIRAWDVTTRTARCALDFLDTSTLSLAGPSDGAWVAAGCLDGTIRFIPGEVFAG